MSLWTGNDCSPSHTPPPPAGLRRRAQLWRVVVLALVLALTLLDLAAVPAAQAQSLPAFPGAEGYGALARGGRGGRVLFVSNRNDSGPGSLRAALEASGPRTVVFRVGGVIRLRRTIEVREPYLTIAGQTAPGDGVVLVGAGIRIRASEVVVRNLRLRVGDEPAGQEPSSRDGLSVMGFPGRPVRNVIIDHCSVTWAIDENASVYQAENVTVQWTLLAEGLEHSLHPKGRHGNGLLLAEGARNVSVHHSLLAHNGYRNPLVKGNTAVAFTNNLVHNWGRAALLFEDTSSAGPLAAVVAQNVFTRGPSTSVPMAVRVHRTTNPASRIFLGRNSGVGQPVVEQPVVISRPALAAAAVPVPDEPLEQLRTVVLAGVGAVAPARDAIDRRIVGTVQTGSGRLIDRVADVGGWEVLSRWNVGVPAADADQDGIADSWEQTRGLSPANSSDAQRVSPSGYPWLEVFLDELTAGATLTPLPAPSPTTPPAPPSTVPPSVPSPIASPALPSITPTPAVSPPATSPAASATPAPPAPIVGEKAIYDDALAAGWQDCSWGAAVVFDEATTVQQGRGAIAVSYLHPWAGLKLHHERGIATAGFRTLRFWVHGGARGGQQLQVYLMTSDGKEGPAVALPVLPAGAWSLVELPLVQLGNPPQLTDLVLHERNGPHRDAFFVDAISLTP
jgi:pectate lyase